MGVPVGVTLGVLSGLLLMIYAYKRLQGSKMIVYKSDSLSRREVTSDHGRLRRINEVRQELPSGWEPNELLSVGRVPELDGIPRSEQAETTHFQRL